MSEFDTILRALAGYNIKRAHAHVISGVNAALAPFGLRRVTFSALSVIVDQPGLRQAQLADALAIERPNMVPIVDELEAAKLIQRRPAASDRRAYALHPTLPGQRLHDRALDAVHGFEAALTEGLSPSQVSALIRALQIVERNGERLAQDGACDVSAS